MVLVWNDGGGELCFLTVVIMVLVWTGGAMVLFISGFLAGVLFGLPGGASLPPGSPK